MRTTLLALAVLLPAPSLAGTVNLSTEDGLQLSASHWGSGSTGVVLIHDRGRSSADWSIIAPKLATDSTQVLALDLRGHGGSTAPETEASNWTAMNKDVSAGVKWLRAHGAQEVSLVGDSLGANLALAVAASDPEVSRVAMLSPGFNIEGVTIKPIDSYGDRPLLVVSAEDDDYATRTAGVLEERASGQAHWELVPGNARGTRMVAREAGLEGLLYSWVHGTFFHTRDGATERSMGKVGDVSDVEATGTRHDGR